MLRTILRAACVAMAIAIACAAAPARLAAQDVQPATLPAPDAMAVQPDPADFISRSDTQIMVQGEPKRFAGIGVSWLGLVQSPGTQPDFPTAFETRDGLSTVQAMASGYVRAASLGGSAGCAACLFPAPGAVSLDALRHMDTVLRQARDAGMKLIIPLSGSASACPVGGDPDPVAGLACVFARWRHLDGKAFYTDPVVRADFAASVTAMLNHLNPLTGLTYRDDPTIMAWENCDGCGAGIDPKILADWTEFLGRTIRATDARHLYENGAFAGRLGKQPGSVPVGLVALPSVDIIGDRVMPGIDANGAGLDAAVDEVSRANRVYIIDAYGWTPAQFPTQDDFQAFLKAVTKNRSITAAFLADLSAHAENGGYLPSGPQGPALYFPGTATAAADEPTMQARARAVRRLSYAMQDLLPVPFGNVKQPVIISAVKGRVTWRGAAGATGYGVARSRDIAAGGSWETLCEACLTDASPVYQDPAPLPGPVWYRLIPYNANNHAGMYSEPVQNR
jgi:hypothetical protein